MKYAIIQDGGKQYKAVEGATVDVDRYQADIGDEVELENVLLVSDGDDILIGTPLVQGARIRATVEAQIKGPKVIVFKYKPKQRYRVKSGHRQKYTRLRIQAIEIGAEENDGSEEE